MAVLKEKKKQPLSLRWKWTILLFLSFSLISLLASSIIFNQVEKRESQQYENMTQERYLSVQHFLNSFDTPFDSNRSQGVKAEVVQFLDHLANFDVTIRVLDKGQRLIYENQATPMPPIPASRVVIGVQYMNKPYYMGKSAIISAETGKPLGSFEFLAFARSIDEANRGNRLLFFKLLICLIVISLLMAFLIAIYFLRPLQYLNSALDSVEEDTLSQIRVRKPRSNDEWSDLSVHINRLLDRIDLYVSHQKQFVEDVSHELRTPVAIVEGHLQLLNRWGKDDPEVLEESIAASLQEISRMKTLVQEMLDLSRADHANIDYKDEITDVYTTVKQVYNNFVILYPDFDFYLDLEHEVKGKFIQIYRNHFEQILIILLDNAVKYSTDRQEIHLSISRNFNNIKIAVQDFGEGMSEEDKKRVFSRFYRVDKARSRDKGGNGLGLSIALQLATSYKGNISVESVLNHGSIFYVEFPFIHEASSDK